MNSWDPTLGNPREDKYYNLCRPQCEVSPRDHGKVVESLPGSLFGRKYMSLNGNWSIKLIKLYETFILHFFTSSKYEFHVYAEE